MKQILIDSAPIRLSVEESKGGKTVARGEFARVDVPTQNGRRYPRSLYEREVNKLQETVARRRSFGELDHPADGKTKLSRASHIITALEVRNDGVVWGEAEIMDTPAGRTLKAILEAGAEVGVSSRGFGSTRALDDGTQEVGEDFTLRTFDFVADPAMQSAYPTIFAESVDEGIDESFLDEYPQLVEGIRRSEREKVEAEAVERLRAVVAMHERDLREQLAGEFEKRLLEGLSDVRTSLTEQFANDPEVVGAKVVLSEVAKLIAPFIGVQTDEAVVRDALAAKDEEISSLKASLREAIDLAGVARNMIQIEQRLAGHPLADRIRKLIGNDIVSQKASVVEARLNVAIEQFADIVEDQRVSNKRRFEDQLSRMKVEFSRLKAQSEEREARYTAHIQKIREEHGSQVNRLKADLDAERQRHAKAMTVAESAAKKLSEAETKLNVAKVEAHRYRRVAGHTNAAQLLSLTEGVSDTDAIDELVKRNGSRSIPNDLAGVQDRVRGFQRVPEAKGVSKNELFEDTMSGIEEMQRLAGIR